MRDPVIVANRQDVLQSVWLHAPVKSYQPGVLRARRTHVTRPTFQLRSPLERRLGLLSCVDWLSCSPRASLHDLAAHARVLPFSCRLKAEGAANAGRWMRPQSRVQNEKVHEHGHHGHTGFARHSLRNGFNGFLRALVSAESARMCERAVLTNRPSLDLSPFVLKGLGEPDGERGTDPVSSSTRTVAGASSPDRARKGAG